MPTLSANLSDDLAERGKAVADASFEGKPGSFLKALVRRELDGELDPRLTAMSLSSANDPNCLVNLARRFCPAYVTEVKAQCVGVDQPKMLEMLLRTFAAGESITPEFLAIAAEEMAQYGKKGKGSSHR